MAEETKVGIVLEASGADTVQKELDSAASSIETFSSAAETAAENAGSLEAALSEAVVDEQVKQDWEDLAVSTAAIAEGIAKQATGIAQMANAFFDATDEVAAHGDEIDKMSQKMGISAKAYQEWDYVLGQSGSSMKKMVPAFDRIKSIQTGSLKDAAEYLEAVGLNLEDIAAMSKEDAFSAIITALQGMEEGAAREQAARNLLGSSYKDLGPLLNTSADDTAALVRRLYELGGVMSDEDVKASAAYGDSVDDLNLKWSLFKQNILVDFLPALTQLRENLIDNGALDTLADKVSTLASSGVNLLSYLVDHSEEAVTAVEAIGVAWGTWKAAEIVKTLVGNVSQLYGWLSKLGAVLGVGAGTAAAGVGLVALGVGSIVDYAGDLQNIGYLGNGHELQEYADNVDAYSAALEEWHRQNDEYLNSGYTEGLEGLQTELSLLEAGLQNAQTEYERMQELAAAAPPTPAEDPGTQALAMADNYGQAVDSVITENDRMLEAITDSPGEIRTDFVTGMDGVAGTVADEIVAANDAMTTNMGLLSGNAEIWGTDMMISLGNGMITGFNTYVLPALNEVAAAIDAYLGHSEPEKGPLAHDSQWMPDMMMSMAKGIRDNSYLVTDAMAALAGNMQPYFDTGFGGGGTTVNYGGVSVTFQVEEGQDGRELFEEFSYWLSSQIQDEGAVYAQ